MSTSASSLYSVMPTSVTLGNDASYTDNASSSSCSTASPAFPGSSFIQLIPSTHYKPPPKRVCNPWLSYKNDLATRYPEVCTLERAPSQRMRIAARLWECESPSVKAEYEKRYQVALRAAGVKGAELDLNRRRVRSEGVTAARRAKRATEGATLSPRSTFLVNAWIGGARGAALIRAVTDWDSANGAEPISKRKKKGAVTKSAEVPKKDSVELRPAQPPQPPSLELGKPPSPAPAIQQPAVKSRVVARAHGPAFGQWVPSPIPLRLTSHLAMPVSMQPCPLGYPTTFAAEWPSPGPVPDLVYADSPASFSMPSPVFAPSPAASSAYTSSPALSHKSPVFFTDSPMAMEYSPGMLEDYSSSLFDSSFDDTNTILPLFDTTNAGAWA